MQISPWLVWVNVLGFLLNHCWYFPRRVKLNLSLKVTLIPDYLLFSTKSRLKKLVPNLFFKFTILHRCNYFSCN